MLKTMDRNALRGFLKGDDTTPFSTPLMGLRWPALVESKLRVLGEMIPAPGRTAADPIGTGQHREKNDIQNQDPKSLQLRFLIHNHSSFESKHMRG